MTGFNPLDLENLADSIARALLANQPSPLGNLPRFNGAGIYALYYTGPFADYARMAAANTGGVFGYPIYTGKAAVSGARTGQGTAGNTTALWSRINKHRDSVSQATNLDVKDFHVRFLVIESLWIPLGETLMINRFQSVWNCLVYGFGSNAPGAGRNMGKRSRWDTLHPGRPPAVKLQPSTETALQIGADVVQYLKTHIP